jgi:hypothetical protein
MLGFEESTPVSILPSDFKTIKCLVEFDADGRKKQDSPREKLSPKIEYKESKNFMKMKDILAKVGKVGSTKQGSRTKITPKAEWTTEESTNQGKYALRPYSSSFSRHKSVEKMSQTKTFIISRKGSADNLKKSGAEARHLSLFTKTTENESIIALGNQINSINEAWTFTCSVISLVESHINHQTWLKMFSKDMTVRLKQIVERKKDDLARQDMRKLEIKYGKKIAQLYDTAQRFTYLKEYEMCKAFHKIFDRRLRIEYVRYEIEKFKRSFTYAIKLFNTNIDILSKNMVKMPKLAGDFECTTFEEKSQLWPLRNIQTYKLYVYFTEDLMQKLISFVSLRSRQILKQYKKLQQDKLEEHANKNYLMELVDLMNFRGRRFESMISQMDSQLAVNILEILKETALERIDWQLTNLFLGFCFFIYYKLKKNVEKGYVILSKAYDANKEMVDLYLAIIVKYFCTRDQLIYYLGESDRRQPERAVYPDISYCQYISRLQKLESRLPYIYDFVENSLKPCMKIEELQEVLRSAGKMSLLLHDYKRAVVYLENYLFMLDSVDRVNISRLLVHGKNKEDKVNELLHLNTKYMKYTNKLLKACFETQQYVKALTLITNLLFIFNNSLNLINYFDPNSHPTKKPNEVIMMDLKKFQEISEMKKYYKGLLVVYTKEWKTAIECHKQIWDIISQAQFKDSYKQSFFIAFREVIEYTESLKLFNLSNFVNFVSRYTNLPNVLQTAAAEEGQIDLEPLTVQDYIVEKQMDYYFPTYVGDFDKGFVDRKVLECITMNKHNNLKFKKTMNRKESLNSLKSVYQDTEAFRSKRVKKLRVWEVETFFTVSFEDQRFINQLYRSIITKYYECNKKKFDRSFITFTDTVLTDADLYSKNLINSSLALMQSRYKHVLRDREEARIKAMTRAVITWAKKVVSSQIREEHQEKLNNIRSVEMREFGKKPYKPSRFYKESKLEFDIVKLDSHLNEYLGPKTSRQVCAPTDRREKSAEREKSKESRTNYDRVNLEIHTKNFFEVYYKVLDYRMHLRKLKRRKRVRTALTNMSRFQKCGKLVSILDQFSSMKSKNEAPRLTKIDREKGAFALVEPSLAEIQNRLYYFDITEPLQHRCFFAGRCRIEDNTLIFAGSLKTQVSKKGVPLTISFPLTCDLFREKERFMIRLGFNFQSFWPIIFEQFRVDYLDSLYKLSKSERVKLLGPQAALYKQFVQNIGLGFALQYTNYKEPVHKAKMEMSYYLKEDYHSLQLLLANLKLLTKTISSLVYRERLGFVMKETIDVENMLETLSEFRINVGVLYFSHLRVKYQQQDDHLSSIDDLIKWKSSDSQHINFNHIQDLIDLFTHKCCILQHQLKCHGFKSFFLCRSSIKLHKASSSYYAVEVHVTIHLNRIQKNTKFFKTMVERYLGHVSDEKKVEFLILVLFFFFEKSFEFEIKIDSFACQKVQKYSSSLKEDDKQRKQKKFILKRNRYFKLENESLKLSFFQYFYLTLLDQGGQSFTSLWDFNRLVNKEEWMKAFRLDYQVNFDLAHQVKYRGRHIMRLFTSILMTPFLNPHLKQSFIELIERENSCLMYFIRDKNVFHVLNFSREDTRMRHYEFSEFIFDYVKLRTTINPEYKLLDKNLLYNIVENSPDHKNETMVNVKFLSLPVDLEKFYRAEAYLQKRGTQELNTRNLLDKSLIQMNYKIHGIKNNVLGEQPASKNTISETLLQKKSKLAPKHQYFEKLLAVDFESITRKGFKQLHQKEIVQEVSQTLEIFDEKSSVVAKGALIYAESHESLLTIMKRYYSTRDKNMERIDSQGYGAESYYYYLKEVQTRIYLEWKVDMNLDYTGLVKNLLQVQTKEKPVYTIKFMFASWNTEKRPDNNLFDMKVDIFFQEYQDRILVEKIKVSLKYPLRNTRVVLMIVDPFDVLHFLRILKIRSQSQMYLQFCFLFSRQYSSMLPQCLTLSVSKFNRGPLRFEKTTQIVAINKRWAESRLDSSTKKGSLSNKVENSDRSFIQDDPKPQKKLWEHETKLFLKEKALDKGFDKLQNIGFLNQTMKSKIKNGKVSQLYSFWNPPALKYQLSKSDELLGYPSPSLGHFQRFTFSFLSKVKGHCSNMLVQAQTYLLLSNYLSSEDKMYFRDCHTVQSDYLATIANRLKHVARLHFRHVPISSDDVPYVKKRLIRKKLRRALGMQETGSIGGLNLWRQTISKIGDTLQQYLKSKSQVMMRRADERLVNIIGELRTQRLLDDRLILDSEELIIILELTPTNSKNKLHKLILSWKDVKKFFMNENFIRELFPNDNDYEKCCLYFASTNPKRLHIDLLRHITRYIELKRQKVFSIPVIVMESSNRQKIYLRNVWSRFNSFRAQPHQITAEEFSNNISVVFHGIRRVGNQYYIVTIHKNIHLKLFEIEFYNARFCRRYSMIFRASSILKSQKTFLGQLTLFLHNMDIYRRFEDFKEFDATWCNVNNLQRRDVLNFLSDHSVSSGHVMNFGSDTAVDLDSTLIELNTPGLGGSSSDMSGFLNVAMKKRTSIRLSSNTPKAGGSSPQNLEKRSLADFVSMLEASPESLDILTYWNQITLQLKSTLVLREMKALEHSIFGRSHLSTVRMKEGTASAELLHSQVAKFSNSFVKALEPIKTFIEMEVKSKL